MEALEVDMEIGYQPDKDEQEYIVRACIERLGIEYKSNHLMMVRVAMKSCMVPFYGPLGVARFIKTACFVARITIKRGTKEQALELFDEMKSYFERWYVRKAG